MKQDPSFRADMTATLAKFAAGTAAAAVPAAINGLMRHCLLDFFGNCIAAPVHVGGLDALRAAAAEFWGEGPGDFTVAGDPTSHGQAAALMLNGAHAHALDFDDTNIAGKIHPGVVICPALLAEAERQDHSGEAFLAAMAIGYEVATRVGRALGEGAYRRGFHPTPVAGLFGAIAAVGRLRGLSAEQMTDAFGLGGSRAAGAMQYLENGAQNKRLHPGFAAHDAHLCVAMAAHGVTGAALALDGKAGVLAAYSDTPAPEVLIEGLEAEWLAGSTGLKPYPSCRLTHAATEAALILRERLDGRPPEGFRLRIDPTAYLITGERLDRKLAPQTIVDGQFSCYFQVAVALATGRADLGSYGLIGDAQVNALAQTVTIEKVEGLRVGEAELGSLGEGAETVHIVEPLGEPSRPMAWGDVLAKFRTNACPTLGDDRAMALAAAIGSLHECASVRDTIRLARATDRGRT